MTAITQLLRPLEQDLREYQHFVAALAAAGEESAAVRREEFTPHSITMLDGMDTINAQLDRVVPACAFELLTVQPEDSRKDTTLKQALQRMQPLIGRGVSVRTLYHHATRRDPATLAYLEHAKLANLEVRTLEENLERLIVVDREVAFIPVQPDRKVALEIRHPGLVWYLISVFEQFWRIAVPFERKVPGHGKTEGITGVQRSIAKLLVEGHLDEAIARRLGMNVRTCRAHIAKLGATLGSNSRTQLGYLLARSGIFDEN